MLDVLSDSLLIMKKINEAGKISWFGTNCVKRIYSVTKGLLCTT